MEPTQAFRVAGTDRIVNINVERFRGHRVVFWEDIKRVFPGVHLVQKGGAVLNMLRDENQDRYMPLCIKHHPEDVLDIVLCTSLEDILANSSTTSSIMTLTPSETGSSANTSIEASSLRSGRCSGSFSESISDLAIAPQPLSASSSIESEQAARTDANTTHLQSLIHSVTTAMFLANQAGTPLSPEQIIALAHAKSGPTSTIKPGFESTVNRKLDAIQDQGAMTQQIALKVLQLQKQMNDRLILIQSKAEAILTQQLELTEYPIPRLFIVLPEESTKYDPGSWFTTKFRLHFICECGEHTQPAGCKIPHYLHLAKHEGYSIREPTEFFKKYGPFLLLMLELIKFGTNINGHNVPAFPHHKMIELTGSIQQPVSTLTAKIDYSLECIDSQMGRPISGAQNSIDHPAMMQTNLADYLNNVEGLEGVELRQLGSFLKTSGKDNLLGNLYRMTTSDGHVKWVCRDHYRSGYQEADTQKLRDVVQLAGGTFDEQLGKVDITLKSSFFAKEFYDALRKSKTVLELVINLQWDFASRDIDMLQETLKKSSVSLLYVDLRRFQQISGGKFLPLSSQYAVLYRLLEPINLMSIHLVLPNDLLRLSNFSPKRPPHLRRLMYEIVVGSEKTTDIRTVAEVLPAGSTWLSLYLWDNSIHEKGSQAVVEAIKASSTRTTLDLSRYSITERGAQGLSEALRINSTITTLNLETNNIGDNGTQLLSEAIKTNLTLRALNLQSNWIREKGAYALAEALKTNSTLSALDLRLNEIGEKGARALSDAIRINPTLVALNLTSNLIGEEGAVALARAIRTNSALIFLSLASNKIGEKGAQALSDALKINCALTTLDLWKSSIGDSGAQVLSEALEHNSTLTTLNLDANSIEKKGARALSYALKVNSTLTTLYLASNSIGDEGAQALSDAFKVNSTLTLLDLRHNKIGGSGIRALSEALKFNSTLITLNLDSNAIGVDGAEALSEALRCNSTLTTLTLNSNSINVQGAQILSDAVAANSTLMTLSLDSNGIWSEGARALSEALKRNSTLTTLTLDSNAIHEEGAQALSEALEINSTLTTLRLCDNRIGENGAQALSKALKSNSALTSLDLRRESFGSRGSEAISEARIHNSNLKIQMDYTRSEK